MTASFGFGCMCAKCSLRGEARAASEARIQQIGDDGVFAAKLAAYDVCQSGAPILGQLEYRYRLMIAECSAVAMTTTGGHFSGMDKLIRLHVEFCDQAAMRLDRMVRHLECSSSAYPPAPAARAAQTGTAETGTAETGTAEHWRAGMLRANAVSFRCAASRWAWVAKGVARDLAGEDSPSFEVWASALDAETGGCWNSDGEHGGGTATLSTLWAKAKKVHHSTHQPNHHLRSERGSRSGTGSGAEHGSIIASLATGEAAAIAGVGTGLALLHDGGRSSWQFI